MSIQIVEIGIGGDVGTESGPVKFSAEGKGVAFSWASGQRPTLATYTLNAPVRPPNTFKEGFTYATVTHTANVGAAIVIRFDYSEDCDGVFTYGSDNVGTLFDDSDLPCSARVWVRYDYVPRMSVSMIGTNVSIAWPVVATNFMLEGSSTWGSNNLWITVTATRQVAEAWIVVKEPVVEPRRFYRLRRP